MRILLAPVAFLYGIGVFIRNFAYDVGLLRSARYPFPVIGIGNLRVGGTGKSPMVEYLVTKLSGPMKIAVLSRGYGRKSEGFVLADENSTAAQIGDEPRQFKQKFPDVTIAVDEKRKSGIDKIKKLEEGVQLILLDDSFQHRPVKPGLNILLTVFNDLYIDDFLLPAGMLREPAFNAKRADVIVVTKTPVEITHLERKAIAERLHPKPYQEVLFSYLEYGPLTKLGNPAGMDADESIEEGTAILISGIANPAAFEEKVKENFKVVKHFSFEDHHVFVPKDLKKVRREIESTGHSDTVIITTEKDAQRLLLLKGDASVAGLPIYYMPIKMAFHDNDEEKFEKIVTGHIRSYHGGHPIYS